jgi:hypothetical protein
MRRNRRAGVEDRWHRSDGQKSSRHGKGLRWLARYVDNDGHEHSKAFGRKADAQSWLDTEVTAPLVTGTYVAPKAGLVTVGAVYASWSAAQAHISPKTAATRRCAWGSRIEPHWADRAVVDVKTAAIRAWVSALRPSRTPSAYCATSSVPPSRTAASRAIRATG